MASLRVSAHHYPREPLEIRSLDVPRQAEHVHRGDPGQAADQERRLHRAPPAGLPQGHARDNEVSHTDPRLELDGHYGRSRVLDTAHEKAGRHTLLIDVDGAGELVGERYHTLASTSGQAPGPSRGACP